MSGEPVTAMGIVRAKPGQERELGRRMADLVGPSRAESGCLAYDLFQSIEEPGVWILIERWRSIADLEAHIRAEHMAAFLARGDEVVAGQPRNFRLRSSNTTTLAEPTSESSGAVR